MTHQHANAETISEAKIGHLHDLSRHLSWPLRKLWLNVRLEDAANIPSDGGVVLAANHLSFLDAVLLMFSTPRRVSFLGKAEYLSAWPSRKLFPAAGMIPVDRSGRGVRHSLDIATRRLEAGEAIGIFPEGTRSRDGALYRGHTGVARLAVRTGAPIIPVGIIGSDWAMPAGARAPRLGARVTVRFGSPIDLGPWRRSERSATAMREITDEVMASIAVLSGQRQFCHYARTNQETELSPSRTGVRHPSLL